MVREREREREKRGRGIANIDYLRLGYLYNVCTTDKMNVQFYSNNPALLLLQSCLPPSITIHAKYTQHTHINLRLIAERDGEVYVHRVGWRRWAEQSPPIRVHGTRL